MVVVVDFCLSAATNKDFDFLYQLKKIAYKEYIEQTWGWDEEFQIKFHKENFSTENTKIIEVGTKQIGTVDVKESTSNIFISGLYLLQEYQSKGIGTKIIKDLIEEAEAKKKRLELEVLKVNSRAKKLYESLGFILEDRDKNKYFMYRNLPMTNEQIEIINYDQQYNEAFAALNRAWLQKYFVVEPIDEEIFANPEEYIINNGGYIFFAKMDDKLAGTFALMKTEETIFELSKMAVAEEFQGKKIGNKMLDFCLEKAKRLNADKIILYSNTALRPAIHLYKKFGFKEVPLGNVEYKRADIKMEIDLK